MTIRLLWRNRPSLLIGNLATNKIKIKMTLLLRTLMCLVTFHLLPALPMARPSTTRERLWCRL